jgi:hypothetical protein
MYARPPAPAVILSITLVHALIVATWEAKKATRRSGFCLPNGIYRGTIRYTFVASIPLTHHSASFESMGRGCRDCHDCDQSLGIARKRQRTKKSKQPPTSNIPNRRQQHQTCETNARRLGPRRIVPPPPPSRMQSAVVLQQQRAAPKTSGTLPKTVAFHA